MPVALAVAGALHPVVRRRLRGFEFLEESRERVRHVPRASRLQSTLDVRRLCDGLLTLALIYGMVVMLQQKVSSGQRPRSTSLPGAQRRECGTARGPMPCSHRRTTHSCRHILIMGAKRAVCGRAVPCFLTASQLHPSRLLSFLDKSSPAAHLITSSEAYFPGIDTLTLTVLLPSSLTRLRLTCI